MPKQGTVVMYSVLYSVIDPLDIISTEESSSYRVSGRWGDPTT